MRSILKAALTVLSTFAIANVMAQQCGPGGYHYQGGNYGGNSGYGYPAQYSQSQSAGSNSPGYYDYQGNQYRGYQDPYGHDGYNVHGTQGGWDHQQGWDDQNYGQQQQYGQHRDQHDGQFGYDHPRPDHPVTDSQGQHIRYYGKPGPDYNQTAPQGNVQPQAQRNQPTQALQSATSYSYDQGNNQNWSNIANAEANGERTQGGGTSSPSTPKPLPADQKDKDSTSKW